MRSFRKIALFLVLAIAADRLAGWCLSNLYEKNHCMHSGGELNHYLKAGNADIAFLGSSRVNTMIDPAAFSDSAINISQPAKHFLYHLAVADLMDQHGKMPSQTLVMNLEVEDLYAENKTRLIDDVFYLKYYYGQNRFVTDLIQSKGMYERVKFLSSCYRFNGENFRLLTNPLQNICKTSGNGYTPLAKTPNDSLRLELGVKDMKKLVLTEINPEFFVHLKHLMKLCKNNNVKLVLLYAPNYYYPPAFRKASLQLQAFCKANQVNYLDFSLNQHAVFKQRSLWFDHIHLNAEGAVLYTQMLKEELAKLQ